MKMPFSPIYKYNKLIILTITNYVTTNEHLTAILYSIILTNSTIILKILLKTKIAAILGILIMQKIDKDSQ